MGTEKLRIRRATKKDRETLLRFHHALYVQHRDVVMPEKLAEFYAYRDLPAALTEDVESLLHSPNVVILLAEMHEQAVGYITGHIETDERRTLPVKGVVEDWLVLSTARGRGVGKVLMDKLVEVFDEAGCHVVESTTWPFNDVARKSHTALGFDEVEIKYRRRLR